MTLLVYPFTFLQIFSISEVLVAINETNIHMIYSLHHMVKEHCLSNRSIPIAAV